jgi:hypothetical protein
MNQGIYEELITQLVSNKINELNKNSYYINKTKIDNNFYGSKPMSIEWELKVPMPHYLWKDAAKLRVG